MWGVVGGGEQGVGVCVAGYDENVNGGVVGMCRWRCSERCSVGCSGGTRCRRVCSGI